MKRVYLIFFVIIIAILPACYIARIVTINVPTAHDYRFLPKNTINSNESIKEFSFINACNKIYFNIDSINYESVNYNFDEFLKEHKTQAFIIIKNDSIYYEKYFNKCKENKFVTSFSVSKSIISALIGIAIDEGKIEDEFCPITNFLPELLSKDSSFSKIRIIDLLQMRSGLWLNENFYNPFSDIGKAYFGRNLKKLMKKLKIEKQPGLSFNYFNYNTQLLSFILEKATGKTTAEYLSEKIWIPLGMESNASWSTDSKKHNNVKAYCCINAVARDFAKIGRLYLNKGLWNGKRIISEKWVEKSTKAIEKGFSYYGYQWWLNNAKAGDFMAAGILGQYIYVFPYKNLIIVRFGKSKDKIRWEKVFKELVEKIP
ncbi:MAG: serine hydrolase [Bacteroidales bacterium]|nr:serine hydrolase [Bacteroidales bacterium]